MTDSPAPAAASNPDGILLVDKPAGWTSHDVVARIRRLAGTRKVGHAGTLDPMATGLLTLGLGPSTRLLTYLVGADKEYLATIRLGASTITDDAEGETTAVADPAVLAAVDDTAITAGIAALTGPIDQVPSSVSAIKVDGKRSYARVRAGEEVALAARRITVSAFEILATRRGATAIDLDVRVRCSSGTYIRALARDLGAATGVGGHLTALRRTEVGPFAVGDALDLAAAQEAEADAPGAGSARVRAALRPPAEVAARLFPARTLSAEDSLALAQGKRVAADGPADPGPLAALDPSGRLIGLAEVRGGALRTLVNFPTDTAR